MPNLTQLYLTRTRHVAKKAMATHITVHWDLCKNQIVVNNLRFVAQWWTLGEGHLLSETVLWDLCRSIYISWPCQPPSTPFNWDLCGSIYEDSWRCNRFNMEPSWGSFDLKPPEKEIQMFKREIFIGRLLHSDHFPKYSFDVCHIMLHTKSLQVIPKNTMSVFFSGPWLSCASIIIIEKRVTEGMKCFLWGK